MSDNSKPLPAGGQTTRPLPDRDTATPLLPLEGNGENTMQLGDALLEIKPTK